MDESRRESLYIEDDDWRVVAVGKELYFVNEFGELRTIDGFPVETFDHILTGEPMVQAGNIRIKVWKIVMDAFVERNARILGVRYIDGEPKNIKVNNLMYVVSDYLGGTRVVYPRVVKDENSDRYRYILDARSGRPVMVLETGQIYSSTHEAAKAIGAPQQNVYSVLSGERKKVKGYTLEYV